MNYSEAVKILEIPANTLSMTTGKDLKKYYRTLATKEHPDNGGNAEKFKLIVSAYELLESRLVNDRLVINVPIVNMGVVKRSKTTIDFSEVDSINKDIDSYDIRFNGRVEYKDGSVGDIIGILMRDGKRRRYCKINIGKEYNNIVIDEIGASINKARNIITDDRLGKIEIQINETF